MDDIIERALRGEATDDELERVSAWRRASPEHERQYQELVRLLGAVRSLRGSLTQYSPPSAAELLARAPAASRTRSTHRAAWLIAAAAVIVVMAVVAIPRILHRASPATRGAEVVTGATELATIRLRDGSVVRLAPSSRLRLPGSGNAREVFLDGRAFFAIAKDPDHPFHVYTRSADAMVLGTRFEVTTQGDDLHLVVVEGRVALAAKSNRVEVTGGEESRITNGTASPPAEVAHGDSLAAWVGKFLVFQSTPMRDVVKELQATYGTHVIINDSTLAGRTITATFTDQPLTQVLAVVCSISGARSDVRNGVVVLSAR